MTQQTKQTAVVMIDLETLGMASNAVVTQIGVVAVTADDPEEPILVAAEYLPIDPQLILGRSVTGDTIIWWMNQSEETRKEFERCSGNDMGELQALVRSIHAKITRLNNDYDAEIWARGPEFDIVKLESIFADLGLDAPWAYHKVRDLRTLMAAAHLSKDDVSKDGLVLHRALDDAFFQVRCYAEAIKRITVV